MRILALDISTHCGFAYRAGEDDKPVHGVWELGSGGNHGRYFSCLANELEIWLRSVLRPELVVMEAPLPHQAAKVQGNHPRTVRVLLGLAAIVEMVCHEQAVKCEEANVIDVRQAVLGRQPPAGKAKEAVMAFCNTMGWKPASDDAADALMLLEYRQCLARRAELVARGR